MEEMSTDMLRKVKYGDKELYNSMTDICFKEFGKNSVEELSIEGRLKMAMKQMLLKRWDAGRGKKEGPGREIKRDAASFS